MYKFTIPPDRDGYSVADGEETLSVQLAGGFSKYRKDISKSSSKLTASWTLNKMGYNYFRSFYKVFTNSGTDSFLMDLFIDDPFELTEHECHFIPNTVKLVSQKGESFTVSANLEVKPIGIDQDKQNMAGVYAYFGDYIEVYDDLFDQLVNFEFPQDLA